MISGGRKTTREEYFCLKNVSPPPEKSMPKEKETRAIQGRRWKNNWMPSPFSEYIYRFALYSGGFHLVNHAFAQETLGAHFHLEGVFWRYQTTRRIHSVPFQAVPGDHDTIVSAVFWRRTHHLHAVAITNLREKSWNIYDYLSTNNMLKPISIRFRI